VDTAGGGAALQDVLTKDTKEDKGNPGRAGEEQKGAKKSPKRLKIFATWGDFI
jgi:hypothetical protein